MECVLDIPIESKAECCQKGTRCHVLLNLDNTTLFKLCTFHISIQDKIFMKWLFHCKNKWIFFSQHFLKLCFFQDKIFVKWLIVRKKQMHIFPPKSILDSGTFSSSSSSSSSSFSSSSSSFSSSSSEYSTAIKFYKFIKIIVVSLLLNKK